MHRPVIAEVLVVAVADAAVAAGRLGLLHGPDHARGEGWAHQGGLPPARGLQQVNIDCYAQSTYSIDKFALLWG